MVASKYDDDGELITGPEAASADGDYFLDCLLVPARAGQELVGPLRGLGEGVRLTRIADLEPVGPSHWAAPISDEDRERLTPQGIGAEGDPQ